MANYPEQVTSADFGTRVAGVREHLARWSDSNRGAVDAEDDNILDRVDALLDEVLVVTAVQNQIVIPRGQVDALTNAIAAVDSALTTLGGVDSSTVTVAGVQDLTNAAETLATHLFSWPPRVDGESWREAVTQAASTYRRSAGQQLASLNTDIEAAKAELTRIEAAAIDLANTTRQLGDEKATELTAQLSVLETQIATAQTAVTTAAEQINSAVTRSDSAISQQQAQFSEAQEERSKEFSKATRDLIVQHDATLDAAAATAQEKVDELDELMKKTGDLVAVFTAAGTANAYSREAVAQGKQANIWRWIAIVLGAATALAAASVLLEAPKHSSLDPWQLVLGKLALGAAIGAVAGYAASQSSRHRRREERAKHLELNLETFGRLVNELGDTNIEDARASLVSAMLKQDEPAGGKSSKDSISDSQITILQRAFDLFRSSQS